MSMKILFLLLFSLSAFAVGNQAGIVTDADISISSAALALSANPYRNYLMIQNNGSANILVKFGSAKAGHGIVITPGGNWEFAMAPLDAVYLEAATGTQSVRIIEGQTP